MQWLGEIGARTVILACEDEFLCSYLSSGLRQLGMNVVASARSVEDVLALAEAEPVPPVACISVNLPGVGPSLIAQLAEQRIPYMLFGLPWTQAAWTTALLWPFSAYQIAQDLQEAVRQSIMANAMPPWSAEPPGE